ncbi:MAG: hypothetical protein HGA49_10820 [Eubacteriaceae bacterium]|nr:hypothetical protein [Eubacteriaceae bacterium]
MAKNITIAIFFFARLILLLIMMLELIACGGPVDNPGNELSTKIKNVALIVFVQSDLNVNDDSHYKIFKSIRDNKIAEAINKNIDECPEITSFEIYALYANTCEANSFGKVEIPSSYNDDEKKTKIKHFLLDSEHKYGKFLDDSKGNKCQDIVGAYYFLRGHQDRYSKYDEIRVVFISDMIQYRSKLDDYDINTDYITFRSLDCLVAFENQVNEGKIKIKNGYVELEKMFNGKTFVVWVIKPDMDGRNAENDETRGYNIDGLWKNYFRKIGATEVKMNM